MTSCYSSFYLTVDYTSAVDGCYEDTTTSFNDLDGYFLDGVEAGGSSVVYASSYVRDDHFVWVVANVYDIDVEEGIFDASITCKDAYEEDATTLHPVQVIQWNCYSTVDEDYTRLDEIETTCGCGTFASYYSSIATPEPTPAPVSPPIATPEPTPAPVEPTPRTPVPITPTPAPVSPPTALPSPTPAPAEPTAPLTPTPIALSPPPPAAPTHPPPPPP
ncbi:unnamed protein product, partial [Ectocarpus sp. 12 AP-2014]